MARRKPELEAIGRPCAEYRRKVLGLTQSDVAAQLGVSTSLVCQFERGKTDSGKILWWYLNRGFHPCEEILFE